jgi:hypothetical protein
MIMSFFDFTYYIKGELSGHIEPHSAVYPFYMECQNEAISDLRQFVARKLMKQFQNVKHL